MHSLPHPGECVEVLCRKLQNLAHVAALCIRRPDCVRTVSNINHAIAPQIHNDFRFAQEAVNMTGTMVLRISDEKSTPEAARRHELVYPKRLRFY